MAKVRDLDKAIQYLKAKMPQAGFFSTLDELIQNSPQAQMPADQWQNYLRPGRVFSREGVNFPLKQEEIDYSGLPGLFKTYGPNGRLEDVAGLDLLHNLKGLTEGPGMPIPREAILAHARRNRPEFNVQKNVTDSDLSGNVEERVAKHMPEETQMIDESHPNWQIAPRSHPDVQSARFPSYAHQQGLPYSYEENITTSPDFGTFPSHFGPTDLSWSRTTRHFMNDDDFAARNMMGHADKPRGPTARLIEEIQSDRHEAAAEKVPEDRTLTQDDHTGEWVNSNNDLVNPTPMVRRGYRTPADQDHLQGMRRVGTGPADYGEYRELESKPPDTPFKDPVDYALLELKKQMLNSANQGDRYLALTRGADQAERYAQDPAKALGMSHVYDKVYPSALNKLARQYGAPVRDIDIPMSGGKTLKPDTFDNTGVDTAEEYHNALTEFDDPEAYVNGVNELIHEYETKLPDVGNKKSLIGAAKHWLDKTHQILMDPNFDYTGNLDETFDALQKQLKLNQQSLLNQLNPLDRMWNEHVASQAPIRIGTKSFPAMEIDPDLAEKIKRIGVPLWTLGGATAAGSLMQPDAANANPVEDESMSQANSGYSKGGNVQFALRRLMAQLRETPEILPASKTSQLLEKGEAALPKPDVSLPPPSPARRMSDQIMENGRPGTRAPATPEQLVARLRGQDLVEPTELNHLLYADPQTNAAINAYQGEMDNAVMQGRPVDAAVREQLAQALDKHAQAPQAAPLGLEAGGSVFDPISAARERIQGAGYAEGGEVKEDPDSSLSKIASLTDRLGGRKRFTVGVAKQLYGLDKEGKPAFGGRAWTQGQGGTPIGLLDEITAAPHNLLSLARTVRGLDPLRSRDSTYGGYQEGIDSLLDKIDPQWSKDAADRLDRLHAAVNQTSGIGDPNGLADHMTDAAASLVTPVPMTKAGEKASLAKRILEMTTPLRPRTGKNFATDTGVLGGLGYGIDELVNRLQRLKAQHQQLDPKALPTSDPTQFSADMGVHPEEGTIYPEINRTAGMQPLPGGGQGIPPETF